MRDPSGHIVYYDPGEPPDWDGSEPVPPGGELACEHCDALRAEVEQLKHDVEFWKNTYEGLRDHYELRENAHYDTASSQRGVSPALSWRVVHALQRHGVTLHSLRTLPDDELLLIRGIGPKGLAEIRQHYLPVLIVSQS